MKHKKHAFTSRTKRKPYKIVITNT